MTESHEGDGRVEFGRRANLRECLRELLRLPRHAEFPDPVRLPHDDERPCSRRRVEALA